MSKKIIHIGLDDTDTPASRGTGSLARQIAALLAVDYELIGITRHQLLLDERVPYTAKNSCAAIGIRAPEGTKLNPIFKRVRALMLADLQPGSDPGLCVAGDDQAKKFTDFGRRAKQTIVTQDEARALASRADVPLEGLAGTQDGVIGALAAVGLSAGGEDGRYIQVGSVRDIAGLQPVPALLEAGIQAIQTQQGKTVESGEVLCNKLRPARRQSKAVLFVEWKDNYWLAKKLD